MNRRHFLQTAAGLAMAAGHPVTFGAATAARTVKGGVNAAPGRAPRFGDGRDWFFARRLGMFVHWGIYATGAWHEQHQYRLRQPRAQYAKLIERFNPLKFDPEAWLDLAEQSGMKYITFTTKHIDGFCMWRTAQTDYNVTRTPYGKDVLGMLAETCHRRKFPLCLYYSIADMHHPNYPSAGRPYELRTPEAGDRPDLARYVAFMKAQVHELCTNYGPIHGFWWDANVMKLQDPSLNALIRKLQPHAVINNRGPDKGDFGTPERDWDKAGETLLVCTEPTEACQSVGSESWGWREDEDYYTDRHLIRSIDKYLARDANYLLNVGPTAEGVIPPESAGILRRIGQWYGAVKESLEGTEPCSQLTANRNVLLTRRGNTLYVHLHKEPLTEGVKLKPLAIAPRRAMLLNDGREVQWAVDLVPSEHTEHKEYLRLKKLPVSELANTVLVVKLEFDRSPQS